MNIETDTKCTHDNRPYYSLFLKRDGHNCTRLEREDKMIVHTRNNEQKIHTGDIDKNHLRAKSLKAEKAL